ncbi:MAG: YihA family ribosome biogenesis GTP-binding protein [Prevotella sp.]|jgi:GTP-binding protein|nr:YihA family ribosome biogenesis GTP-binding protein [Prevotella sp.]
MKIKTAKFLISSPDVRKCPESSMNEYAFIGRSNVGKSSLINMLTGRKSLAKTSSLPGKTLLINHFLVNAPVSSSPKQQEQLSLSANSKETWQLVDLPGYGYAKRSKEEQAKLRVMINDYILYRRQLTCLFILIDIRIPMQKIDLEFVNWVGEHGVPFVIVFTKADKIGVMKQKANITAWMKELSMYWEDLPPYFVTSAETSNGREELLDYIDKINQTVQQSQSTQ